jgi:hypothetical protein
MVGDFMRALQSVMSPLKSMLQMLGAPRPQTIAATAGGAGSVVNFYSSITQSFSGGDREMQVRGAKELKSTARDEQARLARAIAFER